MNEQTVGANADGVGDEAVREATGRSRDEWYSLLDGAGASTWKHRAIATWLVSEHGVDPWWSQGVTVGYEQARGIRMPGQRQDGTFEVSATRGIELEKSAALQALAEVVARETGVSPLALNLGAKHPTARFPLAGGEFVLATSSDRAGGRSSIGLTWGRMPDDSRMAEAKARLRQWLQAVG